MWLASIKITLFLNDQIKLRACVLNPLTENSHLFNSNIKITTKWASELHPPPTKFSSGYPFLKTHSRIMIKADPSTCRENSIQGMVEGKSWWLYILDQYTRIQRSLNTPIQTLCRVIFLNACMHMQNVSEKINLNWQEIPPLRLGGYINCSTYTYVIYISRILSRTQVLTCSSHDQRLHARADQTVQKE